MPPIKYYACFVPHRKIKKIVIDWKECEKLVSGEKGAKYKSFKTEKEAGEWLKSGANYRLKVKSILEPGVYFDAGTGRGKGVEISVTDENGKNLLHKVLPKIKINLHGKHLIAREATNNYGELLAAYYALQIALKKKSKKIFGDSKLVIDYWSRGFIKRNEVSAETSQLADKVMKLRKNFERKSGEIVHISGDDNPADLGFHR